MPQLLYPKCGGLPSLGHGIQHLVPPCDSSPAGTESLLEPLGVCLLFIDELVLPYSLALWIFRLSFGIVHITLLPWRAKSLHQVYINIEPLQQKRSLTAFDAITRSLPSWPPVVFQFT